ncbi:thioredoxin [Candidatus Berkelbacteria bacterium]|nr:thioredoxin [Candidatus Berkelbacteria bacterium]
MSHVTSVTDAEFSTKVLEASKTKPVVVDFWAEWCGPCVAMAPTLEAVSAQFSDQVSFYKHNVDEQPLSPQQYSVMSIPTLIFFKNGLPASQLVGLVEKETLIKQVEQLIG